MELAQAKTLEQMRSAQQAWLANALDRPLTTADLPPWPENDVPGFGGFEFMPEAWIDRPSYLDLQSQALPMLCCVQGMESSACLILRGDTFEKIGVQSGG
jgi:hypothetical protein